jgi:hypothetical protein
MLDDFIETASRREQASLLHTRSEEGRLKPALPPFSVRVIVEITDQSGRSKPKKIWQYLAPLSIRSKSTQYYYSIKTKFSAFDFSGFRVKEFLESLAILSPPIDIANFLNSPNFEEERISR